MPHQHYSIGGLRLRIGAGASMAALHRIPGMDVFAVGDEGEADIAVGLDQPLPDTPFRVLHRFGTLGDSVECRFGLDAECVCHYAIGPRVRLRFDPREPARVDCTAVDDPSVLRFALWVAYGLAGLWRGRVPVHASAVVWGGRAVLCLGESGTGKSTHTRLWTEHIGGSALLNDDSPIVALTPQGAVAYGSPWSGKTPCFRTGGFPLAALVRIVQQPANSILRLPTLQAFAALQPSCPPSWARAEGLMDREVEWLSAMVGGVPVYRLGCRPDAEAARLCRQAVFNIKEDR